MNLIVPFTWRQAHKTSFNCERMRALSTRLRRTKHMGLVETFSEPVIRDLQEWFDLNVDQYSMFGWFKEHNCGAMRYRGLVFKFQEQDDLLMFKLTFN